MWFCRGVGNAAKLCRVGVFRRELSFSSISPKNLKDITNLPLLAQENTQQIATIWQEYHKTTDNAVGFSLTSRQYQKLISRLKDCPMFLVPVYKSESSMMFLLSQSQGNNVLMTYLEEYKSNPHGAQPWLSVGLYTDLMSDKDIALMRSDFLPNISKKEAAAISKILLNCYLEDKYYKQYVNTFNKKPSKFQFEDFSSVSKEKYFDAYFANDES